MIALVLCDVWRRYHSHSPYHNLLTARSPGFEPFEVPEGAEELPPGMQERLDSSDGVVVDPDTLRIMRADLSVPVLCIGNDMHRFDDEGLARLREDVARCSYYLTPYALSRTHTDHPYRYLTGEERRRRLVFFPHHAPPRSADPPRPATRIRRALLTGSVSFVYPLREAMLRVGGAEVERLENRSQLRGDYFAALSRYKVGLTCNSWLDYTVAKYYEIPWSGALLVAPLPRDPFERRLLGFADGVNMVEVEREDFLARYAGVPPFRGKLEHAFELAEEGTVARAGRELVLRRHTADSRLAYLRGLVDAIRAGGFHPDDQYDVFARCSDLAPPAATDAGGDPQPAAPQPPDVPTRRCPPAPGLPG